MHEKSWTREDANGRSRRVRSRRTHRPWLAFRSQEMCPRSEFARRRTAGPSCRDRCRGWSNLEATATSATCCPALLRRRLSNSRFHSRRNPRTGRSAGDRRPRDFSCRPAKTSSHALVPIPSRRERSRRSGTARRRGERNKSKHAEEGIARKPSLVKGRTHRDQLAVVYLEPLGSSKSRNDRFRPEALSSLAAGRAHLAEHAVTDRPGRTSTHASVSALERIDFWSPSRGGNRHVSRKKVC
jgi:hypothetical protein